MFKRFLAILIIVSGLADAYAQKQFTATWVVDGAKEKYENRSHTSLEALEQGSSVIYATNAVDLILTKLRMNKTSGSVVDDDRRETGRNSVLLADAGSKVLLEECDVTSHTVQADGLASSGEGTRVIVQEGTITMNRAGSAAVNAIHGGEVVVQETAVNTAGNQSPAFLALDGGHVEVTGAFGLTAGQASPLFHSDGLVVGVKCRMNAARWTIGNVEDGQLILNKNEVKSGGISGFLLYSTKGPDVSSLLSLVDNKISVGEGPVFLVTNNNNAQIMLKGNKISCKSDYLMEVRYDDWGKKGSNGGHAVLQAEKQSLSGHILVDSISSLELKLNKGGKLNGHINDKENRCAQVRVKMGAGSTWTSKGFSYVTSIEFDQPLAKGLKQLKGNHTIYYDPSDPANAPLEGKEHRTGGGVLRPLK